MTLWTFGNKLLDMAFTALLTPLSVETRVRALVLNPLAKSDLNTQIIFKCQNNKLIKRN